MSKAIVEDGLIKCANCGQLLAVAQPLSPWPLIGSLAILAAFILVLVAILRIT